ncbi:MAG: LCP family protein [Oscillibacter sp.]|jgi:LCP family protein required for cell wall assembly|nr:LCP family protein [Oscillibacter sp.]
MSHKRRRRRSWPRTLLLLLFAAAALAGVYHCIVRKPQLPADSSAAGASVSAGAADPQEDPNRRKQDFYTVLVYGVDDDNGGSDTNILVGFDAGSGAIHCVSIPRDSGVYVRGGDAKINSAYNRGGAELLTRTISESLGIPVDYYVQVNLKGFTKLVDAVGGVDFDVPVNMDYDDPVQDLHIHFQKGTQHLNGQEALEVVRFRHNNKGVGGGYGTEDIGRIGTQQAFLKAVAKKMLTPSNAGKISQYARIFNEYVKSDMKLEYMAWFGTKTLAVGTDNLSFETLPGEWSDARSLYVLDQEKVLELVNGSLNPYEAPRTAEELKLPD